ncbi:MULTISPECIES: sigma-70 family RNA polymerase sigma factor [unclassified Pseudofrankia]|uniref:sigma-70 family RNA polymerase sigma factor n=1 Tax=unclassified Pseudofrankia TaxID=2994372 RepID=UPI0008D93FBF|nr:MULTISPECIES: sigma-70 family RNA polymerase sigma factor [unclassified Pseudofrankia]MDT3438756.1 sigma-70 family RNA polymerase sigma factor [Pseudofrankia sp. BMG5.37]OHV73022.1 RNA polymerase subunit sigma-70 [Pseudofrankia sp. BMG5.36]
MGEKPTLVDEFGRSRDRLRAVAFRLLGSADEADDAVQEAWLRASRADAADVVNVTAWLTTIVSRICLDMLRTRQRRREEFADTAGLDVLAGAGDARDPEAEAVLADSVGLALLVVLDRLGPAERVAFVLHDLFAMPFEEIARIVERSPVAAKKLASRARARVRGAPAPGVDVARQRTLVEAFLAASRAGDVGGLLAVLAPDVVRRADPAVLHPGAAGEMRGARRVAEETVTNAGRARFARPALVKGTVGAVVAPGGRLLLVLALTIEGGRIREITVVNDPASLARLQLAVVDPIPWAAHPEA